MSCSCIMSPIIFGINVTFFSSPPLRRVSGIFPRIPCRFGYVETFFRLAPMLIWIHLELPFHMKFGRWHPQWHSTTTAQSQISSEAVFGEPTLLSPTSTSEICPLRMSKDLLGVLIFEQQLAPADLEWSACHFGRPYRYACLFVLSFYGMISLNSVQRVLCIMRITTVPDQSSTSGCNVITGLAKLNTPIG